MALAFPRAAIRALVSCLPAPLRRVRERLGRDAACAAAVVFYGVLGGFPALLVGGAFGGAAAYALGRPRVGRVRRLTLIFAGLIALPGC